ncbi:MAG: hypothetical protein Fur0022_16710 [Anaerolineales bacterium]
MNFLGIGIPEILFFVLIMLLVLGPTDMVKLGRTLGTSIRKLMTSPTWRMIFSASNTIRNLPNALAREAGVEELRQELKRETESIKKMGQDIQEAAQINLPNPTPLPNHLKPAPSKKPPLSSEPAPTGDFSGWTTPVQPTSSNARPVPASENTILPPRLQNAPSLAGGAHSATSPPEETAGASNEPPSPAG